MSGGVIRSYQEVSPLETPEWDPEVRRYRSKFLFHESCWLRFLKQSNGVEPRGLRLLDGEDRPVGMFVGGEVRKGPFRLLGSPLQGWTTNYMGPLTDGFDPGSFLDLLEAYCRRRRLAYVELCNPVLPPDAMRKAGYVLDADLTYLVTIDEESLMWQRLRSECRNRIRRGWKNGLEVERADDPGVIDEYFAQLQDVFRRQTLVPTYGRDRVQALWDRLKPTANLLALRIRRGGEVIATGFFPHDDRAIYFWGGASWTAAYSLCPNEQLHWNAMLYALEQKIPVYNMCGGGTFKPKFGGREIVVERWFKTLSPWARLGRATYQRYFRLRQQTLGGIARLRQRAFGRGT